ncbi:DUF4124 domain-containing protein [Dyella sp. GSA-30]|uniref:DUF4124 domain-containing protein n=1 Tax=Dyella sp. GSA-30 TaxID=2994496 RepID=UPI00249298B8|nr:DUF4124 domain-containing protein [Dyella sp. GSA-30]BDU18588.1 hypothetical protein DYGSA30_00450 [Dyella sp. GSA-30]
MPKSLCLLLLLIIGVPLHAQDVIHHCMSSDGHPVFTDQPCAAVNATPTVNAQAPAAGSSVASSPPGPPPVLCAATMEALRQSVTDAFAARDPNRLAALMLWSGYGKQSAVTQIQDLGQLMKRPLIGIGGVDEDAPANAGSEAAPSPRNEDDLVVRTASNDGSGTTHETHFAITRRSGCLWLKP